MEQNFKELPQPSFGEAVKKNLSSLTDFKGRSRRSELWWNVLLYCIVGLAALIFLGAFPVARSIVSIVVQIVFLAAEQHAVCTTAVKAGCGCWLHS